MNPQRRTVFGLATGLFLFGLVLLVILVQQTLPVYGGGTYAFAGQKPTAFQGMPAVDNGPQGPMHIEMDITLPLLFPTVYRIAADDCLQSMTINGRNVDDPNLQFCDFSHGRTLSLAPYLQTGKNHLAIDIQNNGGGAAFDLHAAWNDAHVLLIFVTILILVWFALRLLALFFPVLDFPLCIALFGGIFLRILYTLATSASERSYDWGGHFEYVQYLLDHHALPPAHGGWEFYQAPLYYLFSAFIIRVSALLGWSFNPVHQLQFFALILSILTFFCIAWIGKMLFPNKKEHTLFLLFVTVFAVHPSLVFLAPRINNDTLLTLIVFAWLGCLLSFMKSPRWPSWVAVSLLLAIGILTKSNALIAVGVTLVCLAAHRKISWRWKGIYAGTLFGILLVLCSWYTVPRAIEERSGSKFIVSNFENLNGALKLTNTPMNYLTLNPMAMLQHPYDNPWDDNERRANFWEYLLRSSLFGEFDLGDRLRVLAIMMVALTMIGLPLMVIGMIHAFRRRAPFAVLLCATLALFLLGHLMYRLQVPFSPSEDFRFSIITLVPFFTFVLEGISIFPAGEREWFRKGMELFIVCCTVLILTLSLI